MPESLPPPKMSIFDRTLPGVPDSEPIKPESEPDWDEGTCTEWHPRYSERMGALAPAEPARTGFRFRWALVLGGGVGLCVLVAAGVWGFRPAHRTLSRSEKSVPEVLRATHVLALGGDVAAMRTLGLRYAYGLGVPADREEGVRWLQQAARAGSVTARAELQALGAPVPETAEAGR